MFPFYDQQKVANPIDPLCPIFGQCGGCQYQNILYREELQLKERYLRSLFQEELQLASDSFHPIVPSPLQYHYRHRLDLKLEKFRNSHHPSGEEVAIGFSPTGRNRLIPVDDCAIAMKPVAEFLPRLKQAAIARLTVKYRQANLVVKTSDDGRVVWGGIGRRSLQMKEEDYLWTKIRGKKIFYSLDTFFQANLSILTALIDHIEGLAVLNRNTVVYELYGGVGLFGICFHEQVANVVLIEENIYATRLAQYNVQHHKAKNFQIITGKVEDYFNPLFPDQPRSQNQVAIIDPPRQGLSPKVVEMLNGISTKMNQLLYLSCNPVSLVRDLVLLKACWQIQQITPFDFFPRTQHIETLVVMSRRK